MDVDLNADVGESFGRWVLGDDEAILAVVTSANVACGFHAGDPATLRRTCAMAADRGVAIGAQVGYRDLAGFGRRFMDVAPGDLEADVLYQLGALAAMARAGGGRLTYVKPHGALYHAAGSDPAQAGAVVAAAATFDPRLAVLGPPGSTLLDAAVQAGLRAVPEAFVDRAYRADGTLVPRSEPGALLTDPAVIAGRAVDLVRTGVVSSVDGRPVPIVAESLCVHGDTPGAADIARAVRIGLTRAGVRLAPFAPG